MPTSIKEKKAKIISIENEVKDTEVNTLVRIIDLSQFKLSELSAKKCAASAQMVYEFCELSGINPDEFLSDKDKEGKTQQEIVIDVLAKITKIVGIAVKDFDFKSKQWGPVATKFFETIAYVLDADQGKLMSDSMSMNELEDIVFELFGKFQELKVSGFFTRLHTIYKNLTALLSSIEKEISPRNGINQNILTPDSLNGGQENGGMTSLYTPA